jgi:hypothetical protein
MGLTEALPEVAKLSNFILTILATSASAERSFSALRRIQDFTLTKGTTKSWTDYQYFPFSPLKKKKILIKLKEKPTINYSVSKV